MSDIHCRNPPGPEELFLKGKDAEQPIDDSAHDLGSPLPPGPDLGCHQVGHRNSHAAQPPGHPEVKIGRIRKNGEFRPARPGSLDKAPELLVNAGDMVNDLNQPDYRQALPPDDGLHSRFPQTGTRAAEEVEVRMTAPQFLDEKRGIAVARSLSSGDQDCVARTHLFSSVPRGVSKFPILTPTGWRYKLVGVTTEQHVQSYLEQPKRYFNIDGLGEIGIGIMMLGFALVGWLQVTSPKSSLWNGSWGMPAFLAFVFLMSVGIDRGTKFLKKRITYPRTGFVQYRQTAKTIVITFVWSGACGALFTWIMAKGRHINFAALTGLAIAASYAYGIARSVRWKWFIVATLAAGSLAISCLPPEILARWIPNGGAGKKSLVETMRLWLVEAVFIGATMLVSGGITLCRYLRRTQAPGNE